MHGARANVGLVYSWMGVYGGESRRSSVGLRCGVQKVQDIMLPSVQGVEGAGGERGTFFQNFGE